MFGRTFQRDASELLVLAVLAEDARYGYSITKEVAARSGNGVKLTPGVLYPLLARLEREGLVSSSWEVIRSERREAEEGPAEAESTDPQTAPEPSSGRRRKWYTLTAKGRKRLTAGAKGYRDYLNMLRSLLPLAEEGPR